MRDSSNFGGWANARRWIGCESNYNGMVSATLLFGDDGTGIMEVKTVELGSS